MANQMKQLLASADLSGAFGETTYIVDSDYRTGAQGWFRPDGTGPVNLFNARNPGQVFNTVDFLTDAVALQEANDALIDYRGDVLYFTPCNLSLAAAVTPDVPYARWLGQAYKSPRFGAPKPVRNTTITAAITNALTVGAAEGMELGYIRFVPITADESVLFSTANAGIYWHDFLVDYRGVATSAATAFSSTTAALTDYQFDHFTWLSDAPQGPMFDVSASCLHGEYSNFRHSHAETGGTYATSLLDIAAGGAGSDGITVGPGFGQIGAVGATDVTLLVTAADMTGTATKVTVFKFFGSVGYGAEGSLITNTASDIDHLESYIATVPAGAGFDAYTS